MPHPARSAAIRLLLLLTPMVVLGCGYMANPPPYDVAYPNSMVGLVESQPRQLSIQTQQEMQLPAARPLGNIEPVAFFFDQMPTGVTVSHEGRIFVNFPRWGDPVQYTVAELKDGRPIPYPSVEINRFQPDRPAESLVSVQSVVIDPRNRLWILDTGSINFNPTLPGGPKLICVDLQTNRVTKIISFPNDVALPTTYLNDIRFDLRSGQDGIAYITDSSGVGPNGIIVVDLATGRSWRKLNDHPSTKADKSLLLIAEGQPLKNRAPNQPPQPITIGADGIAISADGSRLFYCPLASRRLYSVSTDALADPFLPDDRVAATVRDEGEKGVADGLESDSRNRIYTTNWEHNAILRRNPDGAFETLAHDPRLLWPDTLSLGLDGYLYFTVNQLNRQPRFHDGQDLREKPYTLFRLRADAQPVSLK